MKRTPIEPGTRPSALIVEGTCRIHRRFVRPEEDLLRSAFGAEAEACFRRTRRW